MMQKKLSFKSLNFTNNMNFTVKLRQQASDESIELRTRQKFEQERAHILIKLEKLAITLSEKKNATVLCTANSDHRLDP